VSDIERGFEDAVYDSVVEWLSYYLPRNGNPYDEQHKVEHIGGTVWKVTGPTDSTHVLRLSIVAEEL
jgi:hypothetical protein